MTYREFCAGRTIGMCLALLFMLGISVSAAPPDINHLERPIVTEGGASNSARPAVGSVLQAGTDTVFSLCSVGGYQFLPASGGSDCWGWVDVEGREYALMGVSDGLAVFNTENMGVVTVIPGPTLGCGNIRWRDMVTYQNYAYCVSECTGTNQGLMIVDLSFLPDSVSLVNVYDNGSDITSHNVIIDTAMGFAYVVKRFYNGFRVLDLSNPTSPVEFPFVGTPDIHDMFARNDTVWVAEGSNGTFSVWNMANKNSAQLIQRVSVPSAGYVHNIWPSGDGRHVITTEETSFKTVKFWNVEDYNNIQLVGQYLAPSNLAHNAHMVGDTAFISHYESGVAIVDFSTPASPVEIARYDTYATGENPGFNGAWGAYPFAPSGRIYASNGDGRLFILENEIITTGDTLQGDSTEAAPGATARVDVLLENDTPVTGMNIPFAWGGPFNMDFDSVSTQGLRTEYFELQSYTAFDGNNSRAGYGLLVGDSLALPPGSGPVLSIFFTVDSAATGTENLVDFSGFLTTQPQIIANCVQYVAETEPAIVTLGERGCCVGSSGNVNDDANGDIDISDLTALVNHLFVTLGPLPCPDAANVNGDPSKAVDISDLTALVNHLFVTFEPTAACL